MHTNLDIMSYNYTNIVTDQTCNTIQQEIIHFHLETQRSRTLEKSCEVTF